MQVKAAVLGAIAIGDRAPAEAPVVYQHIQQTDP